MPAWRDALRLWKDQPFMADDITTEEVEETTSEAPATDVPTEGLGDGAKKALSEERTARRDAEKRAKTLEAQVKAFEDASKSDLEKAATRAEQAEKRAQALIERTVKAEIRAASADLFADPSDAVAFLTLADYAGEDGDVDGEQIKADLADLLKRKPHLAKASGRNNPKPDPTQGAKPGGTPDLRAQIAEAEKARDFPRAIALKRQLSTQKPQ